MGCPWPGNVRQLHHVLRGAVALADGEPITPKHFPSLASPGSLALPALTAGASTALPAPWPAVPDLSTLDEAQRQERRALLETLEAQRWNVSHVAKVLDISRNTLYRRMHRLCIPVTQNG